MINHTIKFRDDLELIKWLQENVIGYEIPVSLTIHIPEKSDGLATESAV